MVNFMCELDWVMAFWWLVIHYSGCVCRCFPMNKRSKLVAVHNGHPSPMWGWVEQKWRGRGRRAGGGGGSAISAWLTEPGCLSFSLDRNRHCWLFGSQNNVINVPWSPLVKVANHGFLSLHRPVSQHSYWCTEAQDGKHKWEKLQAGPYIKEWYTHSHTCTHGHTCTLTPIAFISLENPIT